MTRMPPWVLPKLHTLEQVAARQSPVYRYPSEWMAKLARGEVERMYRRDGSEMPLLRWVGDKTFAKQAEGPFSVGRRELESVLLEQQQTVLSRVDQGVHDLTRTAQGLSDNVMQLNHTMTAIQTQLSWLQAAAGANLVLSAANLATSIATLQVLLELRDEVAAGNARIEAHLVEVKWMLDRGLEDVARRIEVPLSKLERRQRAVALGELAKGIERTARATRLDAERDAELRDARNHLENADFKLYATSEMSPGYALAYLRSHEARALSRIALAQNFALQGERPEAQRLINEAAKGLQQAAYTALEGASELEVPALEPSVSRCCSAELVALNQMHAIIASDEQVDVQALPELTSSAVTRSEPKAAEPLRPAEFSRGALVAATGRMLGDDERPVRELWEEAEAGHQESVSEALSRRVGSRESPTTVSVWCLGDHDFDQFRRTVRNMVDPEVRSKLVVKRALTGDAIDTRDDATLVLLNLASGGGELLAGEEATKRITGGARPVALTRHVTDLSDQANVMQLISKRLRSEEQALAIPQVDLERRTNIDLAIPELCAAAA